ncbi:GGDEF domain-containing protein [Hoeflea olei]|uniref:diguanylate cyclase n=1 Tax=Hoeflea olei TaxID=1480615 RepID=A0A1C1YR02_9HYPH|nr:GGDEF domain-containing protein [Hoeflea olei]OCW55846.1 hypothetical protein AWJ14_15340 [Hoeflea olei]
MRRKAGCARSLLRGLVSLAAYPMQRSIHTRFRFAFGVSVACLALMALLGITSSRAILTAYQYSVDQLRDEMSPVLQLQLDLRNADHVAYHYAVEGDASAQARFVDLALKVESRFFQLAEAPVTGSDGRRQKSYALIKETQYRWQATRAVLDEVFLYPPGSADALQAFKHAHFAIEPIYDGIHNIENQALDELELRMANASTVGEESVFALICAILIGVCVFIAMVSVIGRSMLQPIEELHKAAGKLGEKDFSHRVRLRNTTDELGQLATAINLASATLDNLYRELERRSTHDGLTGVYNRAAFDKRIEAELKGADRRKRPVSLLMVDIDHFKRINDSHGHPAGDAVLREVAALFQERTRPADIVTRYGGEEFAVILPETGRAAAAALAERLRTAVEAMTVHCGDGVEIRLTVSIGCATRMPLGGLPEALVKAADSALYEAKKTGRNKIVLSKVLPSRGAPAWQAA